MDPLKFHDLVTKLTLSLGHETASMPVSVAAKLVQFVSEAYVLDKLPEPPAEAPAAQPVPVLHRPPVERLLTRRGQPRLTREEIAARRKAIWTPEKRAEHRRKTMQRLGREEAVP